MPSMSLTVRVGEQSTTRNIHPPTAFAISVSRFYRYPTSTTHLLKAFTNITDTTFCAVRCDLCRALNYINRSLPHDLPRFLLVVQSGSMTFAVRPILEMVSTRHFSSSDNVVDAVVELMSGFKPGRRRSLELVRQVAATAPL